MSDVYGAVTCFSFFSLVLYAMRYLANSDDPRLGRSVQYSEDSEAGDGQRKRFRLSREEEETDIGIGEVKVKKKKKKKKSWNDQEPSTSHALEVGTFTGLSLEIWPQCCTTAPINMMGCVLWCCQVLKAKHGQVCEQEQLASDLDRALSLSQLSSLAASRKLASGSKLDKSKGKCAERRIKEQGIQSFAKGGKHKLAVKASASETARKVKGQKKTALFSPVRSELSSCSNSEYLETRNQTAFMTTGPGSHQTL